MFKFIKTYIEGIVNTQVQIKVDEYIKNYNIKDLVDENIKEHLKVKYPKTDKKVQKAMLVLSKQEQIQDALKTPKITELKFCISVSNGDEAIEIWEKADDFKTFYSALKNFTAPEETKHLTEPRLTVWYTGWTGKPSHKSVRLYDNHGDIFDVKDFKKFKNMILDELNKFPEEFL